MTNESETYAMSDQLTKQLHKMEAQFEDLKSYFASDGKATSDELQYLENVQTKLHSLRERAGAMTAQANTPPTQGRVAGTSGPAPRPTTGDYLTESGWKSVLQTHAGKLRDNGLQRALAAYEKLKEERYDDRLKALRLIFQLALDLNTKGASGIADAQEYLSKVCEFAVKKQEAVEKKKKAGAVSDTDKTMLRNMVFGAAKDISQSAKANTALFGVEVLKACKAFEVHAKAQLDDLEDEVTAEDLLSSLVSKVIPGIGEKLAERVVHEIGKKLVNKMAGMMADKLSGIVKSAGKDKSKKALEKAVGTMVLAAQDAQGAILGVVTQNLIPLCDKVIDDVNAGRELSPQLTAFIEPFVLEKTGNLDAMLESRFGVPSAAKSKQTQIKVFKDMVRIFQEKVIIAKTPSGEKMEWNVTGIPGHVRRDAEAVAQQAAKQREKEMVENAGGPR